MPILDVIGFAEQTKIIPYDSDELTLNTDAMIELDCVENEAPVDSGQLTKLPVEEGADVSDHFKDESSSLTLTVKHSEQSLAFDELIESLLPGRSKDFYDQLREWKSKAQLLVIVTPHRLYDKYIITNIAPSWDPTNSRSFAGTITFQELIRVSTQTVELNAPAPKKSKKKLGVKKMKPASPAKRASALSALARWTSGG